MGDCFPGGEETSQVSETCDVLAVLIHRREALHQQAVDKDVPAADAAEALSIKGF
jgi:hypothetical protein